MELCTWNLQQDTREAVFPIRRWLFAEHEARQSIIFHTINVIARHIHEIRCVHRIVREIVKEKHPGKVLFLHKK